MVAVTVQLAGVSNEGSATNSGPTACPATYPTVPSFATGVALVSVVPLSVEGRYREALYFLMMESAAPYKVFPIGGNQPNDVTGLIKSPFN